MRCPFSAQGTYLPLLPQGRVLILDRVAYLRQGAYFFFVQNKSLIFTKKGAMTETVL